MRPRLFALLVAAAAVAPSSLAVTTAEAAEKAQTYTTRGVVKSFGKDRRYVNIAHDDIPGYMMAMTMSFDPRTPHQLDGIAEGDKVRVTFTVAPDGKRSIDAIAKE